MNAMRKTEAGDPEKDLQSTAQPLTTTAAHAHGLSSHLLNLSLRQSVHNAIPHQTRETYGLFGSDGRGLLSRHLHLDLLSLRLGSFLSRHIVCFVDLFFQYLDGIGIVESCEVDGEMVRI